MPLKINVGLSRKVGAPNYSSRGGSVHFEAEVEATLIRQPAELQKRIRYLFGLAEEAVAGVLGCSTKTIERGIKELDQLPNDPAAGRVRRAGAGRKKRSNPSRAKKRT